MKQHLKILLPFFLFFIALIFFVSNNFFFWDTINLVSAPAHFFYKSNFTSLILPTEIDTGHIPTLGYYIALVWKVFGKNLVVSHLAMLPFVLGIVFQVFLLVKHFVSSPNFLVWAMMLILSDATLLSQMVLISPDIVLLFFFLLGLNAIISQKRNFLLLALFGLFLISMRGIVAAFALFLIDLVLTNKRTNFISTFILKLNSFSGEKIISLSYTRNKIVTIFRKFIWLRYIKIAIVYFLPFLLFVAFHFYHYIKTGWFWTYPDSAWEIGRAKNNFGGLFYNAGIFVWRLVDFGRVFIVVSLAILLLKFRKQLFENSKTKHLLLIFCIVGIVLSIPFLYYKTLTGHRYALPFILIISLITAYLISHLPHSDKLKKIVFVVLIFGSLSGNFWVYPDKIAQGWDSTLGHIPYYSLQQKMNSYLNENQITFSEVGTAFPMLGKHSVIFVNNDTRSFKPKEVGKDTYILYSNVNNDFSDAELSKLTTEYKLVYELKSSTV
ncbi:MAG: hypothetical protein CVT95_01135, partial [Bacteroidetes bacterium HGW-Bacteroidetes-12]